MAEEKKIPSKEDVIKYYKEQIEVLQLRAEFSELNAKIAESEFRRVEAIAKVAQITGPSEDVIQHTVTQEDLDNNPELVENGVKVGEVISISNKAPNVESKNEE